MRNFILILFCLSTLFSNAIVAHKQHAHVHGQAKAEMVISNLSIRTQLTIPALSVIGFEYFPKSEEDKQAVNTAIATLNNTDLFTFYRDMGWFSDDEKLAVTILQKSANFEGGEPDAEDNAQHAHDHDHNHDHETHTDFVINIMYELKEDFKIDVISTSIFSKFPNLDELHLNVVTDETQNEYELSSKKSKIFIKGD